MGAVLDMTEQSLYNETWCIVNESKEAAAMFKRRKTIIRVVSIILCVMMVLGVFSILLYTLTGG